MKRPVNDTDWNEIWGKKIKQWHQGAGKACREFWEDETSAEVYAEKQARRNQERVDEMLPLLNLKPEFKVLDIGAGPGSLALPMAPQVAGVTTVEPAHGMNQVMAREIARQGMENIRCVQKAWEEVDVTRDLDGPYEVVLASMSLGMEDLRGAVEKMEQVCCGRVILFWHAGIPGWEEMPRALWPTLFNTQYHGGPKSDLLFQVLYQMGIYPQVQVTHHRFSEIFPTMDMAVKFYSRRFPLLQEEHLPTVEAYIRENCRKHDNKWIMDFDHATMGFSWTVETKQRRAA